MMTHYVIKEYLRDGTLWVSDPFPATDPRDATRAVIGGYIRSNRWAVDQDGALIYGIDDRGKAYHGPGGR